MVWPLDLQRTLKKVREIGEKCCDPVVPPIHPLRGPPIVCDPCSTLFVCCVASGSASLEEMIEDLPATHKEYVFCVHPFSMSAFRLLFSSSPCAVPFFALVSGLLVLLSRSVWVSISQKVRGEGLTCNVVHFSLK